MANPVTTGAVFLSEVLAATRLAPGRFFDEVMRAAVAERAMPEGHAIVNFGTTAINWLASIDGGGSPIR